jgi:hypothetical protein
MNKAKYLKGPCSHCRSNIEFPVEMVGTIIDCPHCGKPTELLLAVPPQEPSVPRKAIVWTSIAALILILGVVGSLVALKRAQRWAARQKEQTAATNTPPPAPTSVPAGATNIDLAQATPATQADFQVSPVTLEKAAGTSLIYAEGTLKNATDRQRFGVKVELDLLGADGNKVGTAKDYAQVIEPGAEWHFKALVVVSKVASAKLASIKEDQ